MRSILSWVNGILVPVTVALIVAVYVEPVRHLIVGDRVSAQIYVFPWYPLEGLKPEQQLPGFKAGATYGLNREMGQRQFSRNGINAARITISNDTGRTLDATRVDFRKFGKVDAVVVLQPVSADLFVRDADLVDLGKMGPGDRRDVFIWTGYNFSEFSDLLGRQIRVSAGGDLINLKTTVISPEDEDSGAVFRWMDEWGGLLITSILVLISTISFIIGVMYNHYFKVLLSFPDIYEDERVNFLVSPDKFSPNPALFERKPLTGSGPKQA